MPGLRPLRLRGCDRACSWRASPSWCGAYTARIHSSSSRLPRSFASCYPSVWAHNFGAEAAALHLAEGHSDVGRRMLILMHR